MLGQDPDKNLFLYYASIMRVLVVTLGLFAFAAFSPSAVCAQITTTPVTISVTDPNGAGIAFAKIGVVHGTGMGRTTTDQLGHLTVDMFPGQYVLPVSAPGYRSDHAYIDLRSTGDGARDAKNVMIVLEPDNRILRSSLILTIPW
jgi:hypothetical protein